MTLPGFALGMDFIGTGASLLSSAFGRSSQSASARASADALKKEKVWNLSVLKQQKTDQFWGDLMSMWRSGQTVTGGTSAAAVINSNQDVLQRNIDFTGQQYDIQIANAKEAAKARFMGIM